MWAVFGLAGWYFSCLEVPAAIAFDCEQYLLSSLDPSFSLGSCSEDERSALPLS